ncbi:hypothetical protein CC80DRAFT_508694 [Byssothecium circinans]|uniref:Peptidase C19 ubiquitin carboxyl-terminal hydrolase domain-containing protein n=1 Tax=Byssothecium circinans TaxID=147558 RepID=A0A6A5THE5_9PLEO|nr:hypothetical protein CC80DRAFT_508694 [Byssothecium circinans]
MVGIAIRCNSNQTAAIERLSNDEREPRASRSKNRIHTGDDDHEEPEKNIERAIVNFPISNHDPTWELSDMPGELRGTVSNEKGIQSYAFQFAVAAYMEKPQYSGEAQQDAADWLHDFLGSFRNKHDAQAPTIDVLFQQQLQPTLTYLETDEEWFVTARELLKSHLSGWSVDASCPQSNCDCSPSQALTFVQLPQHLIFKFDRTQTSEQNYDSQDSDVHHHVRLNYVMDHGDWSIKILGRFLADGRESLYRLRSVICEVYDEKSDHKNHVAVTCTEGSNGGWWQCENEKVTPTDDGPSLQNDK